MILSLENKRITKLKNIRRKFPNSEYFMENYLREEYKLFKNDDDQMKQMVFRLKSLFETGKGKGNLWCNFFVEDQLKYFVSLWSNLLDSLYYTISFITKAVYAPDVEDRVSAEINQCAIHLEQWLNKVKTEVGANEQSVSFGWAELSRVNNTVIIKQIYE